MSESASVLLPSPKQSRWQLLRSGLVNLFHYADEQFWYEDGRLLLRGNNGTGKSRVLALQLPFLLDAELNPTRMEPDRSPSKRPEWNLLLGGKHRDRLGYTWLELGRIDDDGQEQFFTVGCGLHAVKDRGKVDAWFFTTDRRVDQHFDLVRDRVPHNKAKLAEAISDHGVIYKTRGEYCRAVDDRLFRLRDRYRALVDLLIQLRVPQLSRDFDEKRISAQLSDALPPLAPEILDQVAGAMRDLDEQRARLEENRRSAVAVERFEKHYAGYLRIALKRRVNDFFVEHNKYDRTQRKINEDLRLLQQASEQFETAETAIAKNQSDAAAAGARSRVLRQSPEMKDARRLDDFRDRRDQTQKQAEAAAIRLNEDEQASKSAQKTLLTTAEQLKFDRRRVNATLGDMLAREKPATIAQTIEDCRGDDEPADTRTLDRVGKMIDQCEAGAQQLRKQQERINDADRELQRAVDHRGQCQRQVDDARDRVEQSVTQLRQTRKSLCEQWLTWHDDGYSFLPSLPTRDHVQQQIGWPVDFENTDPEIDDDWFANPSADIRESVQTALDVATSAAQETRAAITSKLSGGEAKLADAETKLAELESGVHLPPDPPATRDNDARVNRPGAPLYQLVDFAASIPDDQHAAWEAGLEASGLLDAWIVPQAKTADPWSLMFADEALGDAFAIHSSTRPESNMTQVLIVADELPDGVTRDQVDALLQSIGCGRDQSQTWFDRDGSWRVGARAGVWKKDAAGHIGITARQRRRAEALERIRTEIEAQENELAKLTQQQAAANQTLNQIRRLSDSRPNDSLFLQAIQRHHLAVEQQTESDKALKEQIAVVGKAKDQHSAALAKFTSMADDLGLRIWCERLDELNQAIEKTRSDLRLLRREIESFHRQAEAVRHAKEAAQNAEIRLKQQRADHQSHQAQAVAAGEAFETLQQSVGKNVQKILEEIAESEAEQSLLKKQEAALQNELLEAKGQQSGIEARLESARETLDAHDQDRRARIASLQSAVEAGLIEQTFDETDDDDDDLAGEDLASTAWTPTRAFAIAKIWRSRLSAVRDGDNAWQDSQNELNVQFKTLEQALLPTGLSPQMRTAQSLQLIQIAYQGVDQSPRGLSRLMNEEVRSQDALISQAERELFENQLIGDIAISLHKNIQAAHKLSRKMNEEVETRPMSTGMRLRFRWRPKPDESEQLRRACKALLKQPGAMSDDEKSSLGEFLQSRIADARARDDSGTWQQHLAEALDYRNWYTFDIERETDGKWERLTKRTHGTGSGGERAVSLIMPMLAALAAYYASADPAAPRIILMDEAYVGIDNEMRAKFMDLLVQFDLDFIMTSEREWGCYATMPSLAIYHLATRPGVDAILPTRWVWNGKRKDFSDIHAAARQPSLIGDEDEYE